MANLIFCNTEHSSSYSANGIICRQIQRRRQPARQSRQNEPVELQWLTFESHDWTSQGSA
jgi:hypothetical protein